MTQHTYFSGALAGRDFLGQLQHELREHRIFCPVALRWEIDRATRLHSRAYRAGFMDAVGAYVLFALEGCLVDPRTWRVLETVDWRFASSAPV